MPLYPVKGTILLILDILITFCCSTFPTTVSKVVTITHQVVIIHNTSCVGTFQIWVYNNSLLKQFFFIKTLKTFTASDIAEVSFSAGLDVADIALHRWSQAQIHIKTVHIQPTLLNPNSNWNRLELLLWHVLPFPDVEFTRMVQVRS